METLTIIGGIALSAAGVWLTIVQIKKMIDGAKDTLGGNRGLLMIGITCEGVK